MFSSRFSKYIPLVVVVFGIFIFSALILWPSSPRASKITAKPLPVKAVALHRGDYSPTVWVYGRVFSTQHTIMRASVTAPVISVSVKEGDFVKKGQSLILLDTHQQQTYVDQLVAEIKKNDSQVKLSSLELSHLKNVLVEEKKQAEWAKKTLDRSISLQRKGKGYISREALDKAKSSYSDVLVSLQGHTHAVKKASYQLELLQATHDKLDAQYKRAKHDLKDTTVRAPFSGWVSEVMASVGSHVALNTPMLALVSKQHYQVKALVAPDTLKVFSQVLKRGGNIQSVLSSTNSGAQFVLRGLSPQVKTGQVGQAVIFDVKSGSSHLANGQHVSFIVQLPAVSSCFQVPLESIYSGHSVYLIESDRLKRVFVKHLGNYVKGGKPTMALISSPQLKSGQSVLATQLASAVNGLLVKQESDWYGKEQQTLKQ